MSADIELDDVWIKFGDFVAVGEANVTVRGGGFFSFLGPSGCGKTTLLRTVSGFLEPSQGRVRIEGQDMAGIGQIRTGQLSTNLFGLAFAVCPRMLIPLHAATTRESLRPMTVEARASGVLWRDIGLGLLVTLGNPKAILFYGALLPAFFDMTTIGFADFLVLTGIVVGISALVYGGYMILADRTRRLMASTKTVKRVEQATGAILIGAGIAVATR